MLSDYFDEYSLNARIRPALLSLLPPTFTIYIAFPTLYELGVGLLSLALVFGLLTAMASYVRYRGRKLEQQLYKKWSSKPTTYILRQNNDVIDGVTKKRYYSYFESNIDGWQAPSQEMEATAIEAADSYYESATRWLLEKTRDKKKYSMIFKENMGYGFRRNCLGIKWHGFLLALLPFSFLLLAVIKPEFVKIQADAVFIHTAIVFSIIMAFWWLISVNQAWVKDSAESYAIRLLAACELIKNT
jgi:hypothetical protein